MRNRSKKTKGKIRVKSDGRACANNLERQSLARIENFLGGSH
jgi:hypothetical protein